MAKLNDPLEIILICWFGAQKYSLLLSILKSVVLNFFFLRKRDILFQDSLRNRNFKRKFFIHAV